MSVIAVPNLQPTNTLRFVARVGGCSCLPRDILANKLYVVSVLGKRRKYVLEFKINEQRQADWRLFNAKGVFLDRGVDALEAHETKKAKRPYAVLQIAM